MLGVSERAGFVPVEDFETEKVLNQFVAGWVMPAVAENWPIRPNTLLSAWSFGAPCSRYHD